MGPGEEEQGFYEQTGNVGSSDTGYLDQGYGADSNTADAQGECGGCMYAGQMNAKGTVVCMEHAHYVCDQNPDGEFYWRFLSGPDVC
jgi:hypothetical protein